MTNRIYGKIEQEMFIGRVEIRKLVDVNEFRSVAKYADANSNIRKAMQY